MTPGEASTQPAPTTYHVVARTVGSNPYDFPATLLYDGEDSSLAYQAYRDGIVVAKLAEASAKATVTLYRQGPSGRPRADERFDAAAWRAKLAQLAAAHAVEDEQARAFAARYRQDRAVRIAIEVDDASSAAGGTS